MSKSFSFYNTKNLLSFYSIKICLFLALTLIAALTVSGAGDPKGQPPPPPPPPGSTNQGDRINNLEDLMLVEKALEGKKLNFKKKEADFARVVTQLENTEKLISNQKEKIENTEKTLTKLEQEIQKHQITYDKNPTAVNARKLGDSTQSYTQNKDRLINLNEKLNEFEKKARNHKEWVDKEWLKVSASKALIDEQEKKIETVRNAHPEWLAARAQQELATAQLNLTNPQYGIELISQVETDRRRTGELISHKKADLKNQLMLKDSSEKNRLQLKDEIQELEAKIFQYDTIILNHETGVNILPHSNLIKNKNQLDALKRKLPNLKANLLKSESNILKYTDSIQKQQIELTTLESNFNTFTNQLTDAKKNAIWNEAYKKQNAEKASENLKKEELKKEKADKEQIEKGQQLLIELCDKTEKLANKMGVGDQYQNPFNTKPAIEAVTRNEGGHHRHLLHHLQIRN